MAIIDPANLSKYIDKRIYKYDTFCIESLELDEIFTYIGMDNSYSVRVNDKQDIVSLHLDEITLYETLIEAQTRQVLDVYFVYAGRFNINRPHLKSAVQYYESLIDENDMEFFILTMTNYQLSEEDYHRRLKSIIEKNPEYLI